MNHNLPAFSQHPDSSIRSGLTKREYIAICAMQAIISCNEEPVCAKLVSQNYSVLDFSSPDCYAQITAKAAVIYADALLRELGRVESPEMSRELLEAQAYNQDIFPGR